MPTKLKAAFLCPCVGTGGADALMCGLIAQSRVVDWLGIGVLRSGQTCEEQIEWVRASGVSAPIHLWHDSHSPPPAGVVPHRDKLGAALAATQWADVVVSWCVTGGADIYPAIAPATVVEYAQNEDQHAADTAQANATTAHVLAACSRAAARSFGSRAGEAAILYNAVDPRRVCPAFGRDRARRLLGIADDEKALLFLGRLSAEKNPQAVIQALTKLPESWRGVFVGRGPMLDTLKTMAMALTPGRVQFTDYVHHVGDFYAAADVFLLASDFEGDSLALHEAAFAGVPIVATNVGSVPELTERFGELFAVLPAADGTIDGQTKPRRHTPDELAAAVLRADRDEFRDGPAAIARGVQWEHFTLPTIAAQWEDFLHFVAESARESRRRPTSIRVAHASPMSRAQ